LNPNIPIQALTSPKIKNLSDYLTGLGTNYCNPKVMWDPEEPLPPKRHPVQRLTVNDEGTMHQLIDAHVHGIFTDYPQVLSQILNNNK
jgi:glycerophosphoryl diester phosphodiesterase